MKIEQGKPGFRPVTITIETAGELAYLVRVVGKAAAWSVADDIAAGNSMAVPPRYAQDVRSVDSYALYEKLAECLQ